MPEWYITTYRCSNGVEEKTKYPVPEPAPKDGARKRERAIRRAEKGCSEAKHEVTRLLNENFRAGRDYHITLEYDKAGFEKLKKRAGSLRHDDLLLAADREAVNFIRRVLRECKKLGIELRYLYVVSDKNGKTLEYARPHVHLVVNREALEACLRKWNGGRARESVLYGGRGGDLGDLAFYMIQQTRYIRNRKKYTPSRNLRKAIKLPPVKSKNPEAELRTPEGCVKIWQAETRGGKAQHLRYWRPPGQAGQEDAGGDAA